MNRTIGTWIIDDQGITSTILGSHYIIDRDRILETRSGNLYDWTLHLVSKADIPTDQLILFNCVFILACSIWNVTFDDDIFANSVSEQQREIAFSRP